MPDKAFEFIPGKFIRDIGTQGSQAVPTYRQPLLRVEWVLDNSALGRSARAARVRHAVGLLFIAYGALLLGVSASKGSVGLSPFIFMVLALPILFNRLGRLGRYFLPVILGFFAYATAGSYVNKYKLSVHYGLQIDVDRWLAHGTTPTQWLQAHLYHGHTGALETICVAFYVGHFWIPLALGVALALLNRSADFRFLMFSILVVSVLGAITFLLAPTAPPWLAAEHSHLTGIDEILKRSLHDLHLRTIAALEGDPRKYDVTAAVPSLHTAYPLICLVAAIRARLPRAAVAALALNLAGVLFAIVYMGEHYVFDVLAGATYAGAALLLVARALRPDAPAARTPLPSPADRSAPASRVAGTDHRSCADNQLTETID